MSGLPADAPIAVLLDALGTLVALEAPAAGLRRELARRFGIGVSVQEAERAIAAEIACYRAHYDSGRDASGLARLRAACAATVRTELASQVEGVTLEQLTDALIGAFDFAVFPDVVPALKAARAHGLRLVVVSNWDCSLEGVLDRLGIAVLLDGVLTSAQAGARKPARAIFEQALALAGAPAASAIHVGDTLEEDVIGARGAGIEPILLGRDGRAGPPGVRTIATLAELAVFRPPT